MRTKKLTQLLAGILTWCLVGGPSFAQEGNVVEVQDDILEVDSNLLGVWSLDESERATRITFNEDFSYEVDDDQDGAWDTRGRYVLEHDQITLQEEEGEISDDCRAPGIYKYEINGDEIRWEFVNDQCLWRTNAFTEEWIRQESTGETIVRN